MELTVDDLLRIEGSHAAGLDHLRGKKLKGVSTDTRSLRPGEVFFAIRGDRYDGHDFLRDAAERGALVAVVDEQSLAKGEVPFPVVVVRETTIALGELARMYRDRFSHPVVAIGGSNGKTTTKEMAAAVLRKRMPVLSTEKNFNNHIGVPLTLFRLTGKEKAAVVEIGTNHPGEIARLCAILNPTHGLVTNIGREHLEFFGDLRGVQAEEGALFRSLQSRRGAVALVNADDERVAAAAKANRQKWSYGFSASGVRMRGELLEANRVGCWQLRFRERGAKRSSIVQLRVPGRHNAMNALAAATVGRCLGVSTAGITEALEAFKPVKERMEIIRVSGVVILNDAYNANPDSVIEALETLSSIRTTGRTIVVLGDMREMGSESSRRHEEIGIEVTRHAFDCLLTYGQDALKIHESADVKVRLHYEEKNVLAEYLLELLSPGDVVLVKGSRGMRMEDIITFVHDRLSARRRMLKAGTA
ncbi:MAG: UDP-N-acetylmuramoyl-tripeptide--D-alanyl-D-alanine ligase [Ignavibacteria bacterium]|nr:UDP-N-acetylmuramoyl-tripeptide--D-alanyl-D-alanine ligase [Ignavibacteria bacterium]